MLSTVLNGWRLLLELMKLREPQRRIVNQGRPFLTHRWITGVMLQYKGSVQAGGVSLLAWGTLALSHQLGQPPTPLGQVG